MQRGRAGQEDRERAQGCGRQADPAGHDHAHHVQQGLSAIRIVIVGISGTGKSRLARRLGAASGLPVHHMDTLIWRPNWVEADRAAIAGALAAIAREPRWIVEGWVDDDASHLLDVADEIIDLDFPGWLAALGGVERWWRHRRVARPELPASCTERWSWDYLATMLLRRERRHLDRVLAGRRVTKVCSRRAADRLVRAAR